MIFIYFYNFLFCFILRYKPTKIILFKLINSRPKRDHKYTKFEISIFDSNYHLQCSCCHCVSVR